MKKYLKNSVVCIIPRAETQRCASHCGVSSLPSVCLDPKFYHCYFSVMPKDITMKIILKVTNCLRNLFYFKRFSINHSWKTSKIWKHENRHFGSSLTPQCDAHPGVRLHGVKWPKFLKKLRGVHHTKESSSRVGIISRSQAPGCASHCRVKLQGVHHTAESESKSLRISSCF